MTALAALFFCSGASALIYQTLWQRQLSLVFGVTVFATATVLAVFMGGLALGSLIAGRIAGRIRTPLVWLGLTEIAIALTALATPAALDVAGMVARSLPDVVGESRALLTLARLVCVSAILIVPATLMGATLPLAVASALAPGALVGPRVATLYAANTGGAIAGAMLAGLVLIGSAGIRATFWTAAGLNGVAGVAALVLARRVEASVAAAPAPRPEAAVGRDDVDLDARDRRVVIGVFALTGFASLALEVIWFRMLVLFVSATTHAFTIMLAIVLAGIAAGSAIAAPFLGRPRRWLRIWAALLVAIGIVVVASLALALSAFHHHWIRGSVHPVAIVAMFPPALLMGAAFPVGVRIWLGRRERADGRGGASLGRLYAANVAGALVGPLVAGFLLLPTVGSRTAALALAGVYVAAGLALLAAGRLHRWRLAATALGTIALFVGAARVLPDPFAAAEGRRIPAGEVRLWRSESAQATAAVYRLPNGGRVLYLDGKHQANDLPEMLAIHRAIGMVPMLLHSKPERALVIGLGGGVTAGGVALFPAAVDLVELSAAVVDAAAWFRHVNFDVLARPNVRLRVDDGRNFLQHTRTRYDVITADIIQPGDAGAGALYSQEYYALARRALDDDGLMLQWVGPWTEAHYKVVVRTFLSVFPDATLWAEGSLLVGGRMPLTISRASVARALADARTGPVLVSLGIRTPEDLLAQFTADADGLRVFAGEGPILTDDRPIIEYRGRLPPGASEVDRTRIRARNAPRVVD